MLEWPLKYVCRNGAGALFYLSCSLFMFYRGSTLHYLHSFKESCFIPVLFLLGFLFTSWGGDVDLAAQFPHLTGVFQNSSSLSAHVAPNVGPQDIFAIFCVLFWKEKWRFPCLKQQLSFFFVF